MRRAHRARLAEAVELRSVLERAAAVLAARRRGEDDAKRLRRLAGELRDASKAVDRAAYASADSALHRAVVQSAGNRLLAKVYEHLGGALKLSVSPELWGQVLADQEVPMHLALVDAIVDRDERGAESAATRLVEGLSSSLLPQNPRATTRSE